MIYFQQPNIAPDLQRRSLLCLDIDAFNLRVLTAVNRSVKQAAAEWRVSLGENLLFDESGLQALSKLIVDYDGSAGRLEFKLQLSNEAIRDYYSHSVFLAADGLVSLPLFASKTGSSSDKIETLVVTLPELTTPIAYPLALAPPDRNVTPLGLLMPFACDHDLLFANQIAVFSHLNRQVRHSFGAILRGLLSRRRGGLQQRVARSWRQIQQTADIHPTAVVEGSVIGRGCRIGAHCVVRYSVLGEDVQLHDGAKVEYAVVGDRTWLMHDLVLYRSLVERDVFLIHGPYQFSYFQHQSGAFASIMMDYRPDAKPIKINTRDGIRQYAGRFLGALLEEGASVLGGTLTSPGITIPAGRQISAPTASVTRAKDLLD